MLRVVGLIYRVVVVVVVVQTLHLIESESIQIIRELRF